MVFLFLNTILEALVLLLESCGTRSVFSAWNEKALTDRSTKVVIFFGNTRMETACMLRQLVWRENRRVSPHHSCLGRYSTPCVCFTARCACLKTMHLDQEIMWTLNRLYVCLNPCVQKSMSFWTFLSLRIMDPELVSAVSDPKLRSSSAKRCLSGEVLRGSISQSPLGLQQTSLKPVRVRVQGGGRRFKGFNTPCQPGAVFSFPETDKCRFGDPPGETESKGSEVEVRSSSKQLAPRFWDDIPRRRKTKPGGSHSTSI